MRTRFIIVFAVFSLAFALLGCGEGEMSAADQAKLKTDFSKGGDASLLTEDEKKRMAESMSRVGASRGTGATTGN